MGLRFLGGEKLVTLLGLKIEDGLMRTFEAGDVKLPACYVKFLQDCERRVSLDVKSMSILQNLSNNFFVDRRYASKMNGKFKEIAFKVIEGGVDMPKDSICCLTAELHGRAVEMVNRIGDVVKVDGKRSDTVSKSVKRAEMMISYLSNFSEVLSNFQEQFPEKPSDELKDELSMFVSSGSTEITELPSLRRRALSGVGDAVLKFGGFFLRIPSSVKNRSKQLVGGLARDIELQYEKARATVSLVRKGIESNLAVVLCPVYGARLQSNYSTVYRILRFLRSVLIFTVQVGQATFSGTDSRLRSLLNRYNKNLLAFDRILVNTLSTIRDLGTGGFDNYDAQQKGKAKINRAYVKYLSLKRDLGNIVSDLETWSSYVKRVGVLFTSSFATYKNLLYKTCKIAGVLLAVL